MPRVSFVLHLHQPIYLNKNFPYERARRIAEEASLMDKYADYGLCHRMYLKDSREKYTPLLTTLLRAAETGKQVGTPLKFGLCLSGLFIEQMVKEDPVLLGAVNKLVALGSVEMLATTYYNSLSSMYPGGMEEFEEQVREQMALVGKVFSVQPRVLANTKLVYNDAVARSAESLGLSAVIADGVPSLGAPSVSEAYVPASAPGIRLLVRDPALSAKVAEGKVGGLPQPPEGFRLIYSDRLEKGGPNRYEDLASWLTSPGMVTASPYEAVEEMAPAGSICVPEPVQLAMAECRGEGTSLLSNAMQRTSYDRAVALGQYVKEVGDSRIKGLWRILQQADHLLCMRDYQAPGTPMLFSSAAEGFSVYNTVLVDFEGKLTTLVQRMRKTKTLAKQATAQAAIYPQVNQQVMPKVPRPVVTP
ncbi:MAG: hypothetical protein JRN39_08105 [Nitrososphaerota archaeon]|nr:hypothetical protein [Nitrososphaerota archaeon]